MSLFVCARERSRVYVYFRLPISIDSQIDEWNLMKLIRPSCYQRLLYLCIFLLSIINVVMTAKTTSRAEIMQEQINVEPCKKRNLQLV
jgi:hypothetical protein